MRAMPVDTQLVASIDKTLHEPARLAAVACLAAVDEADFVFLQSQTGMTGGNLSSHMKKLESAGYITVRKEFRGSRPCTLLALTDTGRAALKNYIATMRELISSFE